MASIFISHSSKDHTWAEKLKAWLEDQQHRSLFLDFDPKAGLKAGDLWEQQLYAKLRQCQIVLALVSQDWLGSHWCFAEAVQAREKGKRLILARIDDADTSGLFRDAQHLDFMGDAADAFARLAAGLVDVFDLDPNREPYPGLIPFDERDAGVFVGRDAEFAALREALESMRRKSRAGGERLLLLLGALGSGKSSLVRAGMLPRLRRRPESWQVLPPMRPGHNPVRELALGLAVTLQQDLEAVTDRLAAPGRNDPLLALADEVRLRAGQPEAAVLLVLDQMEELLGLSEAQAGGQFLDLLRRALEHGDGRFLVLATLRSEYLGEVQLLPFLTTPGPLPYREQTLDPVPLDRLDDIIREPGRRWPQSVEFADRLVERMVRDTGTRDALPLLAFTLNRLWRDTAARADGIFKLEEYERLGGLEGSVQTAADEALNLRRRTPGELEVLHETFVPGLVRVDAAGVRTRRRVFLGDLAPATRVLLKPFVDQGLLVTDLDPEGRETIEVAHEALLRTWQQLDDWLVNDQDALRLLNGLERAARDWEDGERLPELLAHRGGRLAEVRALLGQPRFRQVVGDTERQYLEASSEAEVARAAREREEQERRVRDAERIAEEQRKVARRTKMGALVAVFLMAMAILFGWQAQQQRRQAVAERGRAEGNLELARRTANTLIVDLAQGFRDAVGVRADLVSSILGRARELTDELLSSGQVRPEISRSRGVALNELVTTFLTQGNTTEARKAAEEALATFQQLAGSDPGNARWQHSLALSWERLGDVRQAQGDLAGVLQAYTEAMMITERLAGSVRSRATAPG